MPTTKLMKLFVLLFFGMAGMTFLGAQEPSQPQQQPPGFHFRAMYFKVDVPDDVYVHDNVAEPATLGVKVNLKNYLNFEANILQLKGDSLIFTTKAGRESLADKASVIGTAVVHKGMRSAICLFLPGTGKAGDPLCQVLVIEDTLASFPIGSLKAVNLSASSVGIKLDKKQYQIKSRDIQVIQDLPITPDMSCQMEIYSQPAGGAWKLMIQSEFSHPGTRRELQIYFDDLQEGRTLLKGITDITKSEY